MPFAIKVLLELTAIFAILYGIYHEKELIALEDRFLARFKAEKNASLSLEAAVPTEEELADSASDFINGYASREARAREAENNRRAAAVLKAAEDRRAAGKKRAAKRAEETVSSSKEASLRAATFVA